MSPFGIKTNVAVVDLEKSYLLKENESVLKSIVSKAEKAVEEQIKKKMEECNDFDPTHYEIKYHSSRSEKDSSYRFNMFCEIVKKEGF